MASPTETQVERRQVFGYEVVINRNSWPNGAVTYSVIVEDEQLGGEDFSHIPTNDELVKFLPGYTCQVCSELVVIHSAVALPRLREHLEGHNSSAKLLDVSEVFDQFVEAGDGL